MTSLIKTLNFIFSKWDISMDEFKPIGKILFYVPNFLNSVLIQIWYFLLFPFIYIYFWKEEAFIDFLLFIFKEN